MELEELRKNIDGLDKQVLEILAKRMELVSKIAQYKKEKGIALKQPEREKQLIERSRAIAKELGLSKDFVESLYRAIINESLKIEETFQEQKSKNY